MHDYDTTAGSPSPDVATPTLVEDVLTEASRELPAITLAGCLTVVADVLPRAVLALDPLCSNLSSTAEVHAIPTVFIWKDLESNEVYCHLGCAALEAIAKAKRICEEEGLMHPLHLVGSDRG